MRRDVFQAIADPTRREIIDLISNNELNVNEVAENFAISRPAVSKHIKILMQSGLVLVTKKGRDRYCRANLSKLREVNEWVVKYKDFWNEKLDALGDFLENETNN
ncbi:MAG: transcriptional regulator [Flavobacterium psychrophilum]|nr:MAG: transcriptional regulator [Flavobacterium psychrophilum]